MQIFVEKKSQIASNGIDGTDIRPLNFRIILH